MANTLTKLPEKTENIDTSAAKNGQTDRTQMNLELLQSRWDLSLQNVAQLQRGRCVQETKRDENRTIK